MTYPQNMTEDGASITGGAVSAAELLVLAVSVVRPAAQLARHMRVAGVAGISTKSTETDVVTAADRAVERQVRAALLRARPGDSVLGEEFGTGHDPGHDPGRGAGDGTDHGTDLNAAIADRDTVRVRWILDPIDGTVNYLYGLPQYAVSLAAEVDGAVVAGVVCNIVTGREWTAVRGAGAYTDGRRLTGSTQTHLGMALVATGFGYGAARRADQARVLAGLLPEVRDIRRFGAASLDLCMAAEGLVDAYYERGLHLWDHAAGGLIAREAGLRVTGLRGAPAGPDLLLAAPPALHGPLHDRLAALGAADGD